MITTVIFDVGKVILDGIDDIETALAQHLSETPEKVRQAMKGPHQSAVFRGQITEDDYWRAVLKALCRDERIEAIKTLSQELVFEVPGTRSIIESLKTQGYTLGVLSVHVREWVEFSERKFNYHRYFQVRQYSFDVGLCKPDPLVYLKILQDLGSEPQTAIFIDDRPRNVDAAQALGIHGLVFENAKKLQRDFADLGIIA